MAREIEEAELLFCIPDPSWGVRILSDSFD